MKYSVCTDIHVEVLFCKKVDKLCSGSLTRTVELFIQSTKLEEILFTATQS